MDLFKKLAQEFENANAYECDVSDIDSIQKAFMHIEQDLGRTIDTVIYNAGSGTWGNISESW